MSNSGQAEDYWVYVKGKSKTFHVNILTKYIVMNAYPKKVNEEGEAKVRSSLIDCAKDKDVVKFKLRVGVTKNFEPG